jgi:hypothetical protein
MVRGLLALPTLPRRQCVRLLVCGFQAEEAKACEKEGCGASFGLFTRRHHCRMCGGAFCDAHSQWRVKNECVAAAAGCGWIFGVVAVSGAARCCRDVRAVRGAAPARLCGRASPASTSRAKGACGCVGGGVVVGSMLA